MAKKTTTKPAAKAKVAPAAPAKAAKPLAKEKRPLKKAAAPVAPRKEAAPAKPKEKSKAKDASKNFGNRPAPASSDDPMLESISEEELRKVKTGLTKRDLDYFRKLLREKRAEILGDVESLKTDALDNAAGGNLSNMPLHMADVGSDSYEQEFTLGLMESERKLLEEIHEALKRIQKGVYGVCLSKGVPISRARLEVKPWAAHCIEVERELERHTRR